MELHLLSIHIAKLTLHSQQVHYLPLLFVDCTVLCPVDQFFELTRSVVPENWDEECGRAGLEIEINLGFLSVKLGMLFVILNK